jgi:L-idonate 5-dehydrogenase
VVAAPGGNLALEDVPSPGAGPGRTRVRIRYGGICGSDLHYVLHGNAGTSVLLDPMVLGHEVVGTVETADPEGGVPEGSLVAVHPATPCGSCAPCARGERHLCDDTRYLGSAAVRPHTQGGFADLLVVPTRQLRPLPDSLDEQQAALLEPLAVAAHAVARAGDLTGRRVLVNGSGPIGQLVIAIAARRGVRSLTAVDVAAHSLATARALGATLAVDPRSESLPIDADVVFEATGVPAAWEQAARATRKGGILVQVGLLPPGDVSLPLALVVSRELDYRGSYRFDRELDDAIALLRDGLDLRPAISHVFPVERVTEAFAVANDRSVAAKVLLDFA